MMMGFDCDALWVLAHDLFETLRDGLLDLFLLEFNEDPRWMKTLRLYRLLLRRKLRGINGGITHRVVSSCLLPLHRRGIAWLFPQKWIRVPLRFALTLVYRFSSPGARR